MKRIAALSFFTVFAIAAGCSSTNNVVDPGETPTTDGGASKDAGKDTGIKSDGGSIVDDASSSAKDSGTVKKDGGSSVLDAGQVVDDDAATDSGPTAVDGGTDGSTAVCAPVDVSTFTASWKGPNALHQNACTSTQLAAVVAACATDGFDPTNCATVKQANLGCATCLITDESAATYGPIVTNNAGVSLNIAGCVAAVTSTGASGCGGKVQAATQCEEAACDAVCPITDATSSSAYDQCHSDAQAGGCAAYDAATSCLDTELADDGGAAACNPVVTNGTFDEYATAYGKLFCMTP